MHIQAFSRMQFHETATDQQHLLWQCEQPAAAGQQVFWLLWPCAKHFWFKVQLWRNPALQWRELSHSRKRNFDKGHMFHLCLTCTNAASSYDGVSLVAACCGHTPSCSTFWPCQKHVWLKVESSEDIPCLETHLLVGRHSF